MSSRLTGTKEALSRAGLSALCLFCSPQTAKCIWFRLVMHKKLDLKAPKTLSDKICWLELVGRDPRMTTCSDKYEVRSYVEENGYGDYLVPMLGLYERAEDIPIDQLPGQFVLKCTHGCGFNILCKDKAGLDWPEARKKLQKWMKTDMSGVGLELHYKGIQPRILCEAYIAQGTLFMPIDYKIHCFNGKPLYTMACIDRDRSVKFVCYDNDWKRLDYIRGPKKTNKEVARPRSLEKMLEIAAALARPFPFVRVDFYEADGRPYVGEMTFSPDMGRVKYFTDAVQDYYGKQIKIDG